jgi:hypothetical protein
MCSVAVRSQLRRGAFTLLGALLLLTSACGAHYIAHGSELYADGRYVEAAEVFERTQQRLGSSSPSERARFGLYRGATFLKLGDVTHAAFWLGYARSIVKTDPGALTSSDLALLDASLKAIGNAGPSAPETKNDSELATAPPP